MNESEAQYNRVWKLISSVSRFSEFLQVLAWIALISGIFATLFCYFGEEVSEGWYTRETSHPYRSLTLYFATPAFGCFFLSLLSHALTSSIANLALQVVKSTGTVVGNKQRTAEAKTSSLLNKVGNVCQCGAIAVVGLAIWGGLAALSNDDFSKPLIVISMLFMLLGAYIQWEWGNVCFLLRWMEIKVASKLTFDDGMNDMSSTPQVNDESSTPLVVEIADDSTPAGSLKIVNVGSQVIRLRWCPAGSFVMGSPAAEAGRDNDESQHLVTLTQGFWMGEVPVTQVQWEGIMGNNPSEYLDGKNWFGFGGRTSPLRPVENVSWNYCQEFLKKLNARSDIQRSGLRFALPTEAQWEYACRAGTTGSYGGTGQLEDMGWYESNSGSKTHPVAKRRPNAWGLYDMHGNVWEWCSDWYGDYPSGDVTDPSGPVSGLRRVNRGGAGGSDARYCRSAYRDGDDPCFHVANLGFRVALVPVQ